MRFVIIAIFMTVCILKGYAQSNEDERQVVGVSEFSCKENSPYTGLVTEKVVDTYKKIEDTVVDGYTKIEDAFVDRYLTKEGESVEEAKARLKREQNT